MNPSKIHVEKQEIDNDKKTKPSFESRIDVTDGTFEINDVQSEPKYD